MDRVPVEQNIKSPPTSQSSAIESNPIVERYEQKKKKSMGPGGISFVVGGGTLVVSCVAIYIAVRLHKYRTSKLQNSHGNDVTEFSLPTTTARGELLSDFVLILALL